MRTNNCTRRNDDAVEIDSPWLINGRLSRQPGVLMLVSRALIVVLSAVGKVFEERGYKGKVVDSQRGSSGTQSKQQVVTAWEKCYACKIFSANSYSS